MNRTRPAQAQIHQRTGTMLLQLRWSVPAERSADFQSWYDREHLSDMVAVPGILGGRRFRKVANHFASPTPFNFLTLYQLRNASALNDPAYAKLSTDPSPWSWRAAAGLDISRTVYRQIRPDPATAAGSGPVGSAILHVLMAAEPAAEAAFTAWYDEEHFPAMLAVPGILSGRRYRVVPDDTGFEVHDEQADFAFAAIYELASTAVLDTSEFARAGRRTRQREALGDRIRAHVQTWEQVFPAQGALEAGR